MTQIEATTAGYFPRPDYLIETLKDVEGYQKGDLDPEVESEVEEVFEKGRRDVVRIQETAGLAGLDLLVEGQLGWDDILAFPATKVGGVEMGGIIRFYDNNRYYRKPVVKDELSYERELTVEEYESAREIAGLEVKSVVPGPYSLADLSKNEHYDDERDFVLDYARVLNQELKALEEAGANYIQLDEPSLTSVNDELSEDEIQLGVEAVERALEGIDSEVLVYTYFGHIADSYPQLLDIADGIGVDLVSDPYGAEKNLEAIKEYGAPSELGLGCMDARNTRLESVDELVSEAHVVLDEASPEKLYINPNCGLDFLPWSVMKEKVERIGETADNLRKEEVASVEGGETAW